MTVSEFSSFYNLPRRQVELAVTRALAKNAGRFELPGLGAFQATKRGTSRTSPVDIELYDVHARAPRTASLFAASEASPADQAATPAAPDSDQTAELPLDIPSSSLSGLTERELKLRLTAAQIDQIEQSTALAQAKLRGEVVSYCANSVQLILTSLREEIAELRLPQATIDALRLAIGHALDDLDAVLPELAKGSPTESIELTLSARRAERITAARLSSEKAESSPASLTNCNPSTSNLPAGA